MNELPRVLNSELLIATPARLRLFLLVALLGCPATCHIAWSADVYTVELDQLLEPGAEVLTGDGRFSFNAFSYANLMGTEEAPDPSDLTVAIEPVGDAIVLRVNIDGPSQAVESHESYSIQLAFTAQSLNAELAFSHAELDIDGATLGTAGTGEVLLQSEVFSGDFALPSSNNQLDTLTSLQAVAELLVQDDGDGPQLLVDLEAVPGAPRALRVDTLIEVAGGSANGSGAVLTDFKVELSHFQIPEPSGWLHAFATLGALLLLDHRIALSRWKTSR